MKKIFLFIIIFSSISFAQVIDVYPENYYSWGVGLDGYNITRVGQSFTASSGIELKSAKFYLLKVGSPSGNIYAKLYTHTGSYGYSSTDYGELSASDPVPANSISSTTRQLITFSFPTPYTLTNGTHYVIGLEWSNIDGSASISVGTDDSFPTHSGNECYVSEGVRYSTQYSDLIFYVSNEAVGTTFIPIITFIE
jgi:hypothetical protein